MNPEKFKQKLAQAGIPQAVIKSYFVRCRLNPGFANEEIPSDDHFKTLSVIYELFYKNSTKTITNMEIRSILSVPYSQVEEAESKIKTLFPEYVEEINELYKNDIQVYYLSSGEITYLYELVSDYISEREKLWKVLGEALKVGVFYTESRFEAVEEAVGKSLASDVIYESSIRGFLLHPYYNDPIAAMKYLRSMFDEEMTARILVENPCFLYLFKDEYFIEFPHQKKERERQIREIVEKYQKTN